MAALALVPGANALPCDPASRIARVWNMIRDTRST
jgi:hypothetical protein